METDRLTEAIRYREAKQYEQAEHILHRLYQEDPKNPEVHYQLAWLNDVQGKETDAVPYYEQAIMHGLAGEALRGALLGLGSTYRCLGRYEDAVLTLRQGSVLFPEAREFQVFLAMALYNMNQHAEAMRLLLTQLVDTTHDEGIIRYQKAIRFYQDDLDAVWD